MKISNDLLRMNNFLFKLFNYKRNVFNEILFQGNQIQNLENL